MPYVVLKESKGELRVYYQAGTSIQGENRCRVDVYAPSVSRFTTMASGDISIPKGLKTQGDIRFQTNASGDIEPCVFCHFAVDNIRRTSLKDALGSSLFRKIREKQGEHENLLRPCMLIDHPENGREFFESEGAYPTHEGAEEIFTGLSDQMDQYSRKYGEIADQVWEEEFREHPAFNKKNGTCNG